MDLRRHVAVLWRFRAIVLGGFLVGLALAAAATFHISSHGISWRQTPTYQSDSMLFVTQGGFPWGRATVPESTDSANAIQQLTQSQPQGKGKVPPQQKLFADPGRFSGLASIYSYLVTSTQVRALIPQHPRQDQITAQPFMTNPGSAGETLPVIGLRTTANSKAGAEQLNEATTRALITYIRHQQDINKVPRDQRVDITVLNPASSAVVAQGRKMTGAIVALLLCVILAIALAYVLENLFPRDGARGGHDDGWDTDLEYVPAGATSAGQANGAVAVVERRQTR